MFTVFKAKQFANFYKYCDPIHFDNFVSTAYIMSKMTKRKHVMKEAIWDDYELPKVNQSIVKVVRSRGNNLHEIVTATNEEYLVSMPTKFRKNIWVKRGDYILVEPIAEGDKIKAEIVKIMNKDSIKYYKENNVWPNGFMNSDIDSDAKERNSDMFENTNRVPLNVMEDSESSSSGSESGNESNTGGSNDDDDLRGNKKL